MRTGHSDVGVVGLTLCSLSQIVSKMTLKWEKNNYGVTEWMKME